MKWNGLEVIGIISWIENAVPQSLRIFHLKEENFLGGSASSGKLPAETLSPAFSAGRFAHTNGIPALFDFSKLSLNNAAFSRLPMNFMDLEARNHLASVMDICVLETGSWKQVENWQKRQVGNLLAHAQQRSKFWKERIGARVSGEKLPFLPVQTRSDVIQQFANEGSLFREADQMPVEMHWTSGSSGTPVQFYVSAANVYYNGLRYMAQYFLEGRNLNRNRTQLVYIPSDNEAGFTVVRDPTWLGPFGKFIDGGVNRKIRCIKPNYQALKKELVKEPIGYLVSSPWILEVLIDRLGSDFLVDGGTEMYIPIAAAPDAGLRNKLQAIDIPVRGTYSAEEVGLIASECRQCPGCFHVAKSNVVVEIAPFPGLDTGGKNTGKVLVTHLHSYATPFIRYDLGDIATLSPSCDCGHEGPTLSDIIGRSKALITHADGSHSVFHLRGGQLAEAVPFDEFRIRQTTLQDIVVEISRGADLTAEERETLENLVRKFCGSEFKIEIVSVRTIDWGRSTKRLGFRNELLT